MYQYDSGTRNLYVVDLKDEQVLLDQIWVYTLMEEIIPSPDTVVTIKGFDPDNDR